MVTALEFRLVDRMVGGWRLARSLSCCVVSLDKKLCFTLCLFTQVSKYDLLLGVPCDGIASRPGGSSNTLSCFMLQNLG